MIDRCKVLKTANKIDEYWVDPVTCKIIIRKGPNKKPIGLLRDLDEVSNQRDAGHAAGDNDPKKAKM